METEKADPAQRLKRMITKHKIMPRLALQYRLCEVGADRLGHELLPFQLSLAERSGDIVMLEQNIYALPSSRRSDAQNDAKQYLLTWGLANHDRELDELKDIVRGKLSDNNFEVQPRTTTLHSGSQCIESDVPFTESSRC